MADGANYGRRQPAPDPRAAAVTARLRAAVDADCVILFGSRARGDWTEQSDIDLLLLQADEPTAAEQELAAKISDAAAQESYRRPVPVQLVWRTREDFRHNRRYSNSVETNAVREGIVMPRDPNQYSTADYEDDATEYEYDWGEYEDRMQHAEAHLDMLQLAAEAGKHDLIIGQQAQNALEHGLKALLEAHGGRYRNTHNIGELLGNARHYDPELRDFRLSIPPDIYTEYEGRDEYREVRRQPLLTEQADFLNRTVADAQFIISRAQAVRAIHGPPPEGDGIA